MTEIFEEPLYYEHPLLFVIVADVSDSMNVERINEGLQRIMSEAANDPVVADRAEFALIAFNSETKILVKPSHVYDINLPSIQASGQAYLNNALELARYFVDDRKKYYRSLGIAYYRPWILVLTDGYWADDSQEIQRMADVIHEEVKNKKYYFDVIGVGDEVNEPALAKLTVSGCSARKIDSINLMNYFEWPNYNMFKYDNSESCLMKMTYMPSPIDTSDVQLPAELDALVEQIAKNVHEVWAKSRMDQGWTLGERSDELRHHPCLIPYEELSEEERDYDRNTAIGTLKLICKLGFTIQKSNK